MLYVCGPSLRMLLFTDPGQLFRDEGGKSVILANRLTKAPWGAAPFAKSFAVEVSVVNSSAFDYQVAQLKSCPPRRATLTISAASLQPICLKRGFGIGPDSRERSSGCRPSDGIQGIASQGIHRTTSVLKPPVLPGSNFAKIYWPSSTKRRPRSRSLAFSDSPAPRVQQHANLVIRVAHSYLCDLPNLHGLAARPTQAARHESAGL